MSQVQTLTHKDVIRGFNAANMTVYNWRNGTPTKTRPLPYTTAANGRLEYDADEVAAWAKENGIKFTAPKRSVANKRPGPVAKPKADKPKQVKAARGGVYNIDSDSGEGSDPKPPVKTPAKRQQTPKKDDKKVPVPNVTADLARKMLAESRASRKKAQKAHTPSKAGKVKSRAS